MGALISLVTALAMVAFVFVQSPAPTFVANPTSGLRTIEVGAGSRPVVLLHGFSSAPAEWLPFAPRLGAGADLRFVFPEGGTSGASGAGRAWWPLDLSSHRDATGLPDLTRARPRGLEVSAMRVRALIDEVTTRMGARRDDVALGGFSQGAMVSAEVAFRSPAPLRALVLLSPTVLDEASWREGLAARRGLRVFVAHGRQDAVLAFAITARWVETMRAAGLCVTWFPFDGGHDIPTPVVDALRDFLAAHPVPAPAHQKPRSVR